MRGVYYFADVESGFLRDLASKLVYHAFEQREPILFSTPTLSIVVNGTAVRGGKPFGIGQCFGEDAIIASDALRDQRPVTALTYCELCCVSKADIHSTAKGFPRAAKRLRLEALKIALYRAPQMIAQYIKVQTASNDHSRVDEALRNLGENVPFPHREVHAYFREINGGKRLRGLASEQVCTWHMAHGTCICICPARPRERAGRLV